MAGDINAEEARKLSNAVGAGMGALATLVFAWAWGELSGGIMFTMGIGLLLWVLLAWKAPAALHVQVGRAFVNTATVAACYALLRPWVLAHVLK